MATGGAGNAQKLPLIAPDYALVDIMADGIVDPVELVFCGHCFRTTFYKVVTVGGTQFRMPVAYIVRACSAYVPMQLAQMIAQARNEQAMRMH